MGFLTNSLANFVLCKTLGVTDGLGRGCFRFPFFGEIFGEELGRFIGVSQMSNDCNLVNYDVYIMYSTYRFLIVETTTVMSVENPSLSSLVQAAFFFI